jgi:hypothetical protein
MTESIEYTKLTEDNQYDFLFWCMDLKPPSIDGELFSSILNSNLQNLIKQNCHWQYGYTITLDMIKGQNDVEKNIKSGQSKKKEKEKELQFELKMKPQSREERAKLFSEAASKRKYQKSKKPHKTKVMKAWGTK